MEILIFIGGALFGIAIAFIFRKKDEIHGIIEVDHKTELVRFLIASDGLSDIRTKKAVFEIKHDGQISREEQSL